MCSTKINFAQVGEITRLDDRISGPLCGSLPKEGCILWSCFTGLPGGKQPWAVGNSASQMPDASCVFSAPQ